MHLGLFAKAQTHFLVYDSELKEVLPFAQVKGKTLHSNVSFSLLSDQNGDILISELPCVVTIQYLGFHTYTDTLFPHSKKEILLVKEARYLKEFVLSDPLARKAESVNVNHIQVITSDVMAKMAANTVKDVLSNQLNFRISQDNATGSSNLSLQGIGGQNVKILIDGVPVIGKVFDQIDLSQLNLNNIDRIEIINGPMSVSYGTNALAGTINIITKKQTGKKRDLGLTSFYESNNTYNLYGHYNWSGSKVSGQLNMGRNFFGGWRAQEVDRTWDWNLKELYFARAQLFYKLKNWELNYRSDVNHEKIKDRGLPNIYGEKALDAYFFTKRFDQTLLINGKIKKDIASQTTVSFNTYDRKREKRIKDLVHLNETPSLNQQDYDTNVFRALLVRSTLLKSFKTWGWQAGIDASEEWGRGQRLKNGHTQMGDYAAFVNLQWLPFTRTEIRGGLRAGYHTVYKMPLVPSLQLSKSTKTNMHFRASWAKGFRAPSLKELYLDFVDANHQIKGNDALKAENANNFQLGFDKKWQKQNKVSKFELNLYANQINNKIDLFITSATSGTYQNIGFVQTKGANTSFSYNTPHIKQHVAFAINGFKPNYRGEQQSHFLWSPEIQVNPGYYWDKHKVQFSVFYKYNGKVNRYAFNESKNTSQLQTISAYSLLDMVVSKKFAFGANLSVGSKNILDVTNINTTLSGGAHNATNGLAIGTGRTFFIKIDYQWQKK